MFRKNFFVHLFYLYSTKTKVFNRQKKLIKKKTTKSPRNIFKKSFPPVNLRKYNLVQFGSHFGICAQILQGIRFRPVDCATWAKPISSISITFDLPKIFLTSLFINLGRYVPKYLG